MMQRKERHQTHMSEPGKPPVIPSPKQFQGQFETGDPRTTSMIEYLRRECKLDDRVRSIMKSVDDLTAPDGSAFDLDKLSDAAVRPRITHVDTAHAKIEVNEINGHVVYYIQPKQHLPYDAFADRIAKPSIGAAVWKDFAVQGWLEDFPSEKGYEIWGILIRDLVLNGLNDAYFKKIVPDAINANIAKLLAEKAQ